MRLPEQAANARLEKDPRDTVFMDEATFPRTMLNAIVSPRPIGWISSISVTGQVNLAPFSYFNAVSSRPPMLLFSCSSAHDRGIKDTLRNVRDTGEFVCNLVSHALRVPMGASSAPLPYGKDEFGFAGLAKAESRLVSAPRVAEAPASLECRLLKLIELDPDGTGQPVNTLVIGRVVGAHIRREMLTETGGFDTRRADPLARLGGSQYSRLGELFDLAPPNYP